MKFPEIEYQRPDISGFEKTVKQLLEDFEAAQTVEEQKRSIDSIDELRSSFQTMIQVASVRHSLDISDELYEKEQRYSDDTLPAYQNLVNEFYRVLLKSKFRNELEDFYGHQLFDLAEKSVKTVDSRILDEMKKENELTTKYQKLTSEAKIMFEGEERNLTGLIPFTQSLDRDVRKRAAEARWNYVESNSGSFDKIYDDLVKNRDEQAKKLGYDNFVQMGYDRMLRTDYDAEQVAVFRNLVLKYIVPLAQKLKIKQAERLGLGEMMYYDESLVSKSGNPKPQGEPDWIIDNAKKMYEELSGETGEFINFMLDGEWMDLVNRKSKSPGGYCTMFSDYGAPFIFSNFNGTSHDIDVLTHEAGHAFQVYSSRDQKLYDYYWPTYEACEIHSMSMEFFTWPWMELFFGKDTDKYRYHHLSSSLSFIPYGVTVDEFQHWVYENPNASPAERKAQYREIEKKYMPHKNYGDNDFLENGGWWQLQSHIYQSPFYYIDYTLAQICALQFWIRMQEDKEGAWNDYVRLCKAGGSRPFLELVDYANLKSPFQEDTIKETVEKIDAYLDTIDDGSL